MAESAKAILIRLRDPGALARTQGSVASFAQALAPATIEAKVLETVKDQIGQSFKDKGIDADISIVQPGNFALADNSHIAADVGFAIGGAGMIGLFWFLFSRGRR